MRDPDTDLRRGPGRFPSTHWSVVAGARTPGAPEFRDSLEKLVATYWRPVYVYLRSAWNCGNEDAKDLTQEFMTLLLGGCTIERYEKEKGRFRAYLKQALRYFLLDHVKSSARRKRGGDRLRIPWDQELPEMPASEESPEKALDRVWAQDLMDRAFEAVRKELHTKGRDDFWQVFELYDFRSPDSGNSSYRDLAKRLEITESDVKGRLAVVRGLVRETLRRLAMETVLSEEDLSFELKELFQ